MIDVTVKGNHPYADAFPMASEEEIEELAASIAAVGLIHPIVLTVDGLVLDGRNRLEACHRAGVEPSFETREGSDDDFKEFVIGANTTGRRESMTVQMAAAATSLILGQEKRINGQWRRGVLGEDLHLTEMKKALAQAGTVLDVLGTSYLEAVRDGDTTLNHVYEQARIARERQERAEREEIERAEREQREEEYATEVFATDERAKAWYANNGQQYEDKSTAHRVWLAVDREARLVEEKRRAEEEKARRERQEVIDREARHLAAFVTNFQTGVDMATHPARQEVLEALDERLRDRFLTIENTYLKGH
ncbi:MAG: ParB N-terminal domain-containing protein [Corynebacterium glucuronolyticum]|nr:ParB N-terminal domain-containing protein [Mycobacteriaceae bacterium]MDY5834650.1 ParB N-terminal domain-containing protein [Corynebacterium glucuronolyticum]